MSVLTRITTRAKQIYKKGKAGITWVAAIKRASTQIKSKASPKRKRARAVKRKTGRKVAGIVHNPKLLAAGLGKGPRKSHSSYVKVPNVSGVGQVRKAIGSDEMETADFWLKMFAPRTKKQQRAFYTMIKKELKTGKISIFSTGPQRRAQMRALNYLLGYSQSL